jgi:hypothetical protein
MAFFKRKDIGRPTAPVIKCLGPSDKREKAGAVLYDYLCGCGNTFQTRKYNVTVGRVKSCGCYRKQCAAAVCREMAYDDKTENSFNTLLSAYKIGAKKRRLAFDLSKAEFRKITKQSCYYCESKPKQKQYGSGAKEPYTYNGIDRVDNTIGYTTKNSVPCCGVCNKMKLTLSYDEFISHIRQILRKHG